MKIPDPVIDTVGGIVGTWHSSHDDLDTLFAECGYIDDPLGGSWVEKLRSWLNRTNTDRESDPIDILAKLITGFLRLNYQADLQWQNGVACINEALAANRLTREDEGKIVLEPAGKRFRVALSFPGEHRSFVKQVAKYLSKSLGVDRVLYDEQWEAEFARLSLNVYLPELYRAHSDLIAIFLCADYKQKKWCKLEWRAIADLIATADEKRIMLLSFDGTGAVPEMGIHSGDGYIAIRKRKPEKIAELILQRLRLNDAESARTEAAKSGAANGDNVAASRSSGRQTTPLFRNPVALALAIVIVCAVISVPFWPKAWRGSKGDSDFVQAGLGEKHGTTPSNQPETLKPNEEVSPPSPPAVIAKSPATTDKPSSESSTSPTEPEVSKDTGVSIDKIKVTVMDSANRKEHAKEMQKVSDIVKEITGRPADQDPMNEGWFTLLKDAARKSPDLIVVHWHALEGIEKRNATIAEYDLLNGLLEAQKLSAKTQFLLYSRGFALHQMNKAACKKNVETAWNGLKDKKDYGNAWKEIQDTKLLEKIDTMPWPAENIDFTAVLTRNITAAIMKIVRGDSK